MSGPHFLLCLYSVPLSIHAQSRVSAPCQHGVPERKEPCACLQGTAPGELVKGCVGRALPVGPSSCPRPRRSWLPMAETLASIWSLSCLCGQPPARALLPPPVGRARGPARLPHAGGESPPDGSSVGHESLRFSFSEQRVSLNCL